MGRQPPGALASCSSGGGWPPGSASAASDVIHHFACEHMALMKFLRGDISLNKTVGLTVRIFNRVLDMLLLGASYPASSMLPFEFHQAEHVQRPEHLWLPPAGHLHCLLIHHVLIHRLPRGPHCLPGVPTCSVPSTCCFHVWSTPSSTGPGPRKSGSSWQLSSNGHNTRSPMRSSSPALT